MAADMWRGHRVEIRDGAPSVRHCGLQDTPEGHDGCLGTLPENIVMNACCGHGNRRMAYIQYWDRTVIEGPAAIEEQRRLKWANG